MGARQLKQSRALIDGHVHVYRSYDVEVLLDGAVNHFRRAASALAIESGVTQILLLTESSGDNFFRMARDAASGDPATPWTYRLTDEPDSIVAERTGGDRIVLVAGRQIATSERLEVLAIGRDTDYQDGQPIDATLNSVETAGALAVVPWAFGKWWRGRGELVKSIVSRADVRELFLGDNGGRPGIGFEPPIFKLARERGIRILPGSDPLPLPSHAGRVGSFGFVLDAPVSTERPAESLRSLLPRSEVQIRPFGSLQPLTEFLRNQLATRRRTRPS